MENNDALELEVNVSNVDIDKGELLKIIAENGLIPIRYHFVIPKLGEVFFELMGIREG